MELIVPAKRAESKRLALEVENWVASGNKITQCSKGKRK